MQMQMEETQKSQNDFGREEWSWEESYLLSSKLDSNLSSNKDCGAGIRIDRHLD